jgi:uncharacterized protein YjbI with pentapeptide repeats
VADPRHLGKLKEGVGAWNAWRRDSPEKLDLSGANLSDARLAGINLSETNLGRAYLSSADLSKSDLRGADLSGADLVSANLSRAILRETKLDRANLYFANLSESDLERAKLRRANLPKAKLNSVNLKSADASRANLDHANLSGADLRGAELSGANLDGANLRNADLRETHLRNASLYKADLGDISGCKSDFTAANLRFANLRKACLTSANLYDAVLCEANLSHANLTDADLRGALLLKTVMESTTLTGCRIYGVSAWDVKLEGAVQSNLVINPDEQSTIQVDDLEVAQFIYLLLSRQKLRKIITTVGEKAVLILGRFTERKELLERMSEMLRSLHYIPMIFDFERPTDRDLTETVKILAGLSRFVIADITNPLSVPLELQSTVPDYMVPFVTILQRGFPAFAMFDDLPSKYHWALPLLEYNSTETLLGAFQEKIVAPALEKAAEVRRIKGIPPLRRSAED